MLLATEDDGDDGKLARCDRRRSGRRGADGLPIETAGSEPGLSCKVTWIMT